MSGSGQEGGSAAEFEGVSDNRAGIGSCVGSGVGSPVMESPFDRFEDACTRAFAFLVERYGFAPPEIERIGRESYVRYHKGPRTVSIAWEYGAPPIVELFFPSLGTAHPPTPWADREGVPYARRFPRWAPSTAPVTEEREWAWSMTVKFDGYLSVAASNLALMEEEFLSAP